MVCIVVLLLMCCGVFFNSFFFTPLTSYEVTVTSLHICKITRVVKNIQNMPLLMFITKIFSLWLNTKSWSCLTSEHNLILFVLRFEGFVNEWCNTKNYCFYRCWIFFPQLGAITNFQDDLKWDKTIKSKYFFFSVLIMNLHIFGNAMLLKSVSWCISLNLIVCSFISMQWCSLGKQSALDIYISLFFLHKCYWFDLH